MEGIDIEQNEVYNDNNKEQNVLKEGERMTMQQIRKKAKMTQNDTSKKTGLTIKFISEVENGRRNPSDKSKRKFAKAYNVPVVEIFLACQRTKCSKNK